MGLTWRATNSLTICSELRAPENPGDEIPMAYRRLPEVIAQHAGTVKVLHTLRPFAVVMAGTRELDPWKDYPVSNFCCHSRARNR
jgi:hypothetical protein